MAHEHDHHDHEHGPDCGCGHDHHDHEHGPDCGCGHDHHDHGHEEIRGGVKIERHEGALICSMTFDAAGEYKAAKQKLSEAMKNLSDDIDAAKGIVGHIKAFISGDRQGAMLSTTGEVVSEKEVLSDRVTINLVAIAFVSDEDVLIDKVAAVRDRF